jgi:hypothetical protein
MKLYRSGAQRFHGWKLLADQDDLSSIIRDSETAAVTLRFTDWQDPSGSSFDYSLKLSLDDIRRILDCLSKAGLTESRDKVAKSLARSAKPLLRLLNAANGI